MEPHTLEDQGVTRTKDEPRSLKRLRGFLVPLKMAIDTSQHEASLSRVCGVSHTNTAQMPFFVVDSLGP